MRVKIVVMPDGQLSAFIAEGSYEEGRQRLQGLLAALGAGGVEFTGVGEVEQHRHDAGQSHLTEETHAES